MSKTKRTPGPWIANGMEIWQADTPKRNSMKLICKAIHSEADARLIAAAPELLDVAQELWEWLSNLNRYHGERPKQVGTAQRLFDAIAKARGESK